VDFAKLWEIIEQIDFKNLQKDYSPETFIMTDCQTHWATVRLGGKTKEVSIYNLHRMAEFEHHPAAVGFLELWEAIDRLTPHGKVSIEKGRPKPWWQMW